MTAPWCGQPLPDDRDGWHARAMAFKESAEEAEAERDAALNSMAELLAQAAAERDAARRETERLRHVLTLLLSHCSAHEQSAKLVGERAWWVATVPDPLEQARAALGESRT